MNLALTASFKEELIVDGFNISVVVVETEDHKANIQATASRAGKLLGISRLMQTKLTMIGLISLKSDKIVKSAIQECAIPMALSDARENLRTIVNGVRA